ncbi:oligosaccharide flippase family protein [Oceanicella actignis]|uniref:Polysaccharide transporter, PST family n=1 Tax=Oceanicella actignis TaxID=1189325 RepID=A0A1M7T4J4_9RHOB|nr:oligosaccharide flippase family protein [Oceanicella actignis]SET41814.1 polysaccharide transporter, PST family [Oceanicella actignis]SHN65663.1 polysaccharide transporter, PST family [Oceanicella actignis]
MSATGLLRSIGLIGGAKGFNILMGLIRVKIVAVMLGPSGVGTLGIYANIVETGAELAGVGIGQSGMRELAAARDDARRMARLRRALAIASLVQGAAGMALIWLFRGELSQLIFGNDSHAFETGLLGLGVLAAVLTAAQTALLRAMQRIGDVVRVAIFGSTAGTAMGLGAIWIWGASGLVALPLAAPAATALAAFLYARRAPAPAAIDGALQLWGHWNRFLRLGAAFMGGALLATATLLAIRTLLTRSFGIEGAGMFQAAWALTQHQVAFLISAMGADYFPKLSSIIKDKPASIRLANDQTALALSLAGPVVMGVIGLAPWLVSLLYSPRFAPAIEILQWQALGNLLLLTAWPLGFIMVARKRGRLFFATHLVFNGSFLAIMLGVIALFGLAGAGIAFPAAQLVHVVFTRWQVGRIHGFSWEPDAVRLLLLNGALGAGTLAAAHLSPSAGAIAGLSAACVATVAGMRTIGRRIGPQGRLGGRVHRLFVRIGWPIAPT